MIVSAKISVGLTGLFLLLFTSAQAQQPYEPVDIAAVKKRVESQSGRQAYEQLVSRMHKMPGAQKEDQLSAEDYRFLYYGSVGTAGHEGREEFGRDQLKGLASKAGASVLLARCDSVLALRPADLVANYYKGLGLYLQDTADAQSALYRAHYAGLAEAVLSSGNGAGCGSAFQVLSENDALESMRYLGIPGTSGQQRIENCVLYRIRSSPIYKSRSIHFDSTFAPESPGPSPDERKPGKAPKQKR